VRCRHSHSHGSHGGCASHPSEHCEPENGAVRVLKAVFGALGLLQLAEALHDSERAAAAILGLVLAASAAQWAAGGPPQKSIFNLPTLSLTILCIALARRTLAGPLHTWKVQKAGMQ
jgi:hypothetical protein